MEDFLTIKTHAMAYFPATEEEFQLICRTDPPHIHIDVKPSDTGFQACLSTNHDFAIAGLLGNAMVASPNFANAVCGAAVKYMKDRGVDPAGVVKRMIDEYEQMHKQQQFYKP